MQQPKKQWSFWTFGGSMQANTECLKDLLGRFWLSQVSSATSERVFSSVENICTVRRTNLSVSKIQLVFIKENSKLLDEIPDLKWLGYF